MTTARQTSKPGADRYLCASVAGIIAVLALAISGPSKAAASPEKPVVTDPQSGIAISGFDPVAYFTDAMPGRGEPDLELTVNGVVWRFRNEGNRAAFSDNPEVYVPQFGGFDPVAIARGVSVAGHPMYWVVTGQHLYLFYSETARRAFLAEPQRIIEAAERKWPGVQNALP